LKKHAERPLLECYQELAKKFPQGLADVALLPEELSGAVNAITGGMAVVETEARAT
jgi:hypothetical protein